MPTPDNHNPLEGYSSSQSGPRRIDIEKLLAKVPAHIPRLTPEELPDPCPLCYGGGAVTDLYRLRQRCAEEIRGLALNDMPCPKCRPEAFSAGLLLRRDARMREFWSECDIPKKYRGLVLDDFVTDPQVLRPAGISPAHIGICQKNKADVEEYLGNLRKNLKDGLGLVLHGPPGTGKTMMGYIIAQASVRQGWDTLALLEGQIFDWIKLTYQSNDGPDEREILKKFSEAKLLVIDDFGTRRSTEWAMEMYDQIFQCRWNHDRATCITTNLDLDTVASGALGDQWQRILSRLQRNKRVYMSGTDFRGITLGGGK